MKRKLRVEYSGPHSEDLDKVIEEFALNLGFKEWARGYSIVDKTRDFGFDREEEEDEKKDTV